MANFKISILKIIFLQKTLAKIKIIVYNNIVYKITTYGELAERSKAAVLKTVEVRASWGSNP